MPDLSNVDFALVTSASIAAAERLTATIEFGASGGESSDAHVSFLAPGSSSGTLGTTVGQVSSSESAPHELHRSHRQDGEIQTLVFHGAVQSRPSAPVAATLNANQRSVGYVFEQDTTTIATITLTFTTVDAARCAVLRDARNAAERAVDFTEQRLKNPALDEALRSQLIARLAQEKKELKAAQKAYAAEC